MRLERLLKLLDLGGAENVVEEHLGEDVVRREVEGALVAVERGEHTRAVGSGGREDGAGYCCQAVFVFTDKIYFVSE